jgi:3-methyl-2-oxobutanoate hydroxymethyltransferase
MLTAYDAMSARLAEAAGVPMLLVGDSLGMVVQGHTTTVPVKLEHMIYHAEIVARTTQKPLVVGDLPFMSYSVSVEQALTNAARMMQEAQVQAVKLEGGEEIAPTIARITRAGIPVMAHIGLTPQSIHRFGGFRVQGKELEGARHLIQDALAIEAAGAFAVVLELVPRQLAELITRRLSIPTIGIGAGEACSGQVQVFHDVLALYTAFLPRHAKRYLQGGEAAQAALQHYADEVQQRAFPTNEHSFSMKADIIAQLEAEFLKG